VSLAALSLVLGKTLVYPRDLTMPLDERDYAWLGRSGKDKELARILGALNEDAMGTSYPGRQDARRYETLLTKLNKGTADPLRGDDFYQDVASPSSRPTYPEFICVPYPRRSPEGVVPEMPEAAVLVVSVKAPEPPREERATSAGQQQDASTPERVAMLETLGELVGTILVSASALGKPKGVWDTRLRV
ncbi:MAG TPA: hypothetical protein VKC57_13865, partial [Ktedonobacterales bacterium]|nr:hypothetical protein [Ktedonobacterales bacterium]